MVGVFLACGIMAFDTVSFSQTQAQDFDSMEFANHLGTVLASEAACGLTYNQDAIAALISDRVEADDMAFPSLLDTMTSGAAFSLGQMGESQKTAHCVQIRRIALSFGFVTQ